MTLKSMNVVSGGKDFVTVFWARIEMDSPYTFQTLTIRNLKEQSQIGFVRNVFVVNETDSTNPPSFQVDGKKNFRVCNALSKLEKSVTSIELDKESLKGSGIIMPDYAVALGSDVDPLSSAFILSEPEGIMRKDFTFINYSKQKTILLPDAKVILAVGGRNNISRKSQKNFLEELRDGLKNNYDENLKLFNAMYEEAVQKKKK